MKIKKYIASSMPEAMKKIRGELGNEAVILHSKVIHTGGFFGLFRKRNIEVLAAIDPSLNEVPEPKKKEKPPFHSTIITKENNGAESWSSVERSSFPDGYPKRSTDNIMKQLEQLNHFVQQATKEKKNYKMEFPFPIKHTIEKLEKHGIDSEIQANIVNKMMERWYLEGSKSLMEEVENWVKEFLIQEISPFSFGKIDISKKMVNVIGPTGVGKTTTLAKIAADIMLKQHKKVGFITTDTYRIAAIEQLKTYANILNVPLEVCYNLVDFEKAIKKLESCDVILIDTAGRNFRNKQYVEDLKTVVNFEKEMQTMLVLSITAKQLDMEEIYQQFSTIHIDQFIFTKMDETSTYGSIINLILKYKKGVAYLTTGQNVPDDMIPGNPNEIVNRIIEVDENDRSSSNFT
jgi:flagellar biosynthesis protein FlhF